MSDAGATAAGADSKATARQLPLRTIVLLATAAFASSINIRVVDPLLPQIAQAFSVSVGAASAIITAFLVAYGLMQLLFGPVGDRFGKYVVVALTAIAAGLATAAGALTTSLEGLVMVRLIAGAFAGAAIPLAFAWLGDAVPFERRQPVLARFLTAQVTGIVLGQAFGGIIGDQLGWQAVFWIIGAIHILSGSAMLVELMRHPEAQPPGASSTLGVTSIVGVFLRVLGRPWVRVLLLAVFLEAFALYGALAYVGAHLHHRFGLSFTHVGIVLSAFGVGAGIYAFSARQLIPWLGQSRLVLSGGFLMAASLTGLALLPVVAIAPVLMAMLGLAFYLMHNVLQNSATQMAPEARGLSVSLFAFALFAGQSVGVALAAPIIDHWGAPPIFLAAALLLPLTALWFCRKLRAARKA